MSDENKEAAIDVNPVSVKKSYFWSLNLDELYGNCKITYTTDAPFRAQQGKIFLFKSADFDPASPTNNSTAWCWDSDASPFQTNTTFGSGLLAVWCAQATSNGPYVVLAQTPVTA